MVEPRRLRDDPRVQRLLEARDALTRPPRPERPREARGVRYVRASPDASVGAHTLSEGHLGPCPACGLPKSREARACFMCLQRAGGARP